MAQVSDFLNSTTVRNTAIGIGVAILVPIVAKVAAPYIRPAARSALKIGVVAYEKGREAISEVGEIIDDMVAEVRDELRTAREQADAAMGDVEDAIDEAAGAAEDEVGKAQAL